MERFSPCSQRSGQIFSGQRLKHWRECLHSDMVSHSLRRTTLAPTVAVTSCWIPRLTEWKFFKRLIEACGKSSHFLHRMATKSSNMGCMADVQTIYGHVNYIRLE